MENIWICCGINGRHSCSNILELTKKKTAVMAKDIDVVIYDLLEEVRKCTQVNTWMVKQYVVVYLDLDTVASIGLGVKVYVVDRGQYSNCSGVLQCL